MGNKYVSKYNCNFDVPNNYEAKTPDKTVFENALVSFLDGAKGGFSLLFEGQTVPNTMDFYWDFVEDRDNNEKVENKQSKKLEVNRADGKALVIEAVIGVKDAKINQDYVAYFFRLDERFNYVGAFAFAKQEEDLNAYRKIISNVFASMESPLKKLDKNVKLDPNILI